MKTALVTSGGGFQGLGLVRALQQSNDTRVIVCDIFPENVTRYLCPECVVAPPLAERDGFAEFLFDLVQKEHITHIFPATAQELLALSQLRGRLKDLGATTAVSEHDFLTVLLDKRHIYSWLRANRMPVLDGVDPVNFDFAHPLFGRPRHGWGGRGTVVLRHARDLASFGDDPDDYLWTRWLPDFEEYSADFAIKESKHISTIVLRQRIRTSGGFAVISKSKSDDTLENLMTKLAHALAAAGGVGLFNVQILICASGEPVISDINPRIGTSATHALGEGINLPGFFMGSDPDGDEPAPAPHRRAIRSVRVLTDLTIPEIKRPAAIVFDLDDTLVDHKLWMLEKIEATYRSFFYQYSDKKAYLLCAVDLIDEGVRADLIDRLLGALKLPQSLRGEAIEAYRAATVPRTPLFSDVIPVLRALKAAGFPLAILTDNPPATQKAKIECSEALQHVDAVIYTREHGAEKPSEAGFNQASRELRLDPDKLIMVGDNYFRDGVGAVRAGYGRALIVRRDGIFLNHHHKLANVVDDDCSARIDVVDNLLSAYYACLGS
jgi:FMN phosphatase YigB (HAD superfamily)